VRKLVAASKRCWSGVGCALQTLPAASWKMLSWLRQENTSLDSKILERSDRYFCGDPQKPCCWCLADSAAKEWELLELATGHHASEGSWASPSTWLKPLL